MSDMGMPRLQDAASMHDLVHEVLDLRARLAAYEALLVQAEEVVSPAWELLAIADWLAEAEDGLEMANSLRKIGDKMVAVLQALRQREKV